jgi:hypothetical protein
LTLGNVAHKHKNAGSGAQVNGFAQCMRDDCTQKLSPDDQTNGRLCATPDFMRLWTAWLKPRLQIPNEITFQYLPTLSGGQTGLLMGIRSRSQCIRDFFSEDGGVSSSYMFGQNATITIDKERNWQSQNAPVQFAEPGASKRHRIIHMKVAVELANWFCSVVHGDANHLKSLRPVLVLKFNETRSLFPAGTAPCCPEIKQDDLAAITRQVELFSVNRGYREFRCKWVDGRRHLQADMGSAAVREPEAQ